MEGWKLGFGLKWVCGEHSGDQPVTVLNASFATNTATVRDHIEQVKIKLNN